MSWKEAIEGLILGPAGAAVVGLFVLYWAARVLIARFQGKK